LSITTFRYVPPHLRDRIGDPAVEEEINRLNQTLLDTLQKEGEAFVSNAVIGGRYALRACIVNFNTTVRDVEALPETVVRPARRLYGLRRPPSWFTGACHAEDFARGTAERLSRQSSCVIVLSPFLSHGDAESAEGSRGIRQAVSRQHPSFSFFV